MKSKILTFVLISIAFVSCSSDDSEQVNNFVNTTWEATGADGMMLMSFDFISETECKLIVDLPLFPPTTYFFDYTYKEYTAELIDKDTRDKSGWICTINGSTMSVKGRSEVFKRTK